MSLLNLFNNPARPPLRPENAWFSAGLANSYPNITTTDDTILSSRLPICKNQGTDAQIESTTAPSPTILSPVCKIFQVPTNTPSQAVEIDLRSLDDIKDLKDQVMVFQYQSEFFAIDHRCPHSSFPLSNGTPFDIEDFGVVLSKGIRCPKHDWSFDLFRGVADRGGYKLGVWESQVRDVISGEGEEKEKEVWVRRKQRIG